MSLSCLVCHGVESPSRSFRSYSISSSENEGNCSMVACCSRGTSTIMPSSKVTPQPAISDNTGIAGVPRLVRSHAIRRDNVRNWNFDELELAN